MRILILGKMVFILRWDPVGWFYTLRPRQNGLHFTDDIFKWIFLNENVWISIKISLNFVPKGWINNIPVLVQIMAWRHPGDKPLSEPMIISLLKHICVTRPQWFYIMMLSYPYRKSHCGDKTVIWLSYLHNGISYTGKMTPLYWIKAQAASWVAEMMKGVSGLGVLVSLQQNSAVVMQFFPNILTVVVPYIILTDQLWRIFL